MRIDWWTLALQAINVLILVWLLGRFLFRPVMEAVAARQAAADRILAGARETKDAAMAEAQALKVRNDEFLATAAARRAAMEDAVETDRRHLLAQARTEADEVVRKGHSLIEAERAHIGAEWAEKAAALASRMASALLLRISPEHTTDAMLSGFMAQIAELDDADRHKLAMDGGVTIVAPEPLPEAIQANIVHALGGALPNATPPAFAVDPALIAGIELRTPHLHVRNSWRADLDTMLATVQENGNAHLG
ncbi:ATPase [Tardiphaga sp.]|uniref:ATPase n=1 Tax=Tardiphaga sp. TaxID=1926292 RepID=UPI00352A07DE